LLWEVAQDAVAAMRHLAGQPYVDRGRIAVMGWSHGASAALEVEFIASVHGVHEPEVVIGFYPWCGSLHPDVRSHTLLFLAGRDDWTPSANCVTLAGELETKGRPLSWVLYKDASHSFDQPGPPRVVLGHQLEFHPLATSDARERVKAFLERHFNGTR
jgi:dienelactone hydrolase